MATPNSLEEWRMVHIPKKVEAARKPPSSRNIKPNSNFLFQKHKGVLGWPV